MKRIMALVLVLLMGLLPSTYTVLADEVNASVGIVTIEGDLSNPQSYANKVTDLLSNSFINEVRVIDRSLLNSAHNASMEEDGTITPSVIAWWGYKVSNVKKSGGATGAAILAKANGTPGTTLSISQTKSVSNSYSVTISSIGSKAVSAAVGFSVSSSESISISGSATVPETNGGKKVRTMTLNARASYDVYTFNVEKALYGVAPWKADGKGQAMHATGVVFTKTYTYI